MIFSRVLPGTSTHICRWRIATQNARQVADGITPYRCAFMIDTCMATQRTIKLLGALLEEERGELAMGVAAARRGTLVALLDYLLARIDAVEEPAKEEVFRVVFERDYTKKEDYLLRNEYRLLNNRIYDLLAHRRVVREAETRDNIRMLAVLRSLFDRGLLQEFESQAAKALEQAEREYDFDTARQIDELLFECTFTRKSVTAEMLLAVRDILQRQYTHIRQLAAVEEAKNRSRLYSVEKMLRTANYPLQESSEPAIENNLLVDYYIHAGLTFRTDGEESIGHAREAVRQIMQLDETLAMYHGEKSRALNSLALAYSMHGMLHEAGKAFEEAINFSTSHSLPLNIGLIFNYSSILMKLGSYAAVLALGDRYRDMITTDVRLKHRFESFRCYCHLFLGEPDRAFDALPPQVHQLPPFEVRYFRYVYLIMPYQHGETEQALRETLNYQQYFRRAELDTTTHVDRELVKIFRSFFTVLVNAPGAPSPRKLALVQEKIARFGAIYPDFADYLPVLWLQREVRKLAGE